MNRTSILALATLAASAVAIPAYPAGVERSEAAVTAQEGVLRCGGNHRLRLGGTEVGFTSWTLRNHDISGDIVIGRIVAADANGRLLYDSATQGLPLSDSGLIGPGNNVLGANQSVEFDSHVIVGRYLEQNERPIQLEIRWSAQRPVISLHAGTTTLERERNPSTGAIGQERSRSSGECRTIFIR